MTNEEKAKEIIRKYREYVFSSRDYGIEQCLLEMAEWKDEKYAKAFAPILIELDELKHQIKSLLP